MAILTDKQWNGEYIKAIIKFSDSLEYEVTNKSGGLSANSFIKSAKFSLSEGNNNVNPLGIASSGTLALSIYEPNDNLSPMNTNSPYYGKMTNGVEIKMFISYDGETWEAYGIYYVTSWGGSFSNGWHGLANIAAEDKINVIGNMEMPEIRYDASLGSGVMLYNVLTALGVQFTIDSRLPVTMEYGIPPTGKVRDFINNVCQLWLARVIMSREGVLQVVPALDVYLGANTIELDGEDLGGLSNANTSNINYNKVIVRYLQGGEQEEAQLFSDTDQVIPSGEGTLPPEAYRRRALDLEQVTIRYKGSGSILGLLYTGYTSAAQISTNVSGSEISDCEISGRGWVVSTQQLEVSQSIEGSSVVGGRSFIFDTGQMMSSTAALQIAVKVVEYIKKVSRVAVINETVLTPKLNVGDMVKISGTNTLYDGEFKIVNLTVNFDESYSLSARLIRTGGD